MDITGKNRDILFKNKKFPKWNEKNLENLVNFVFDEIDENIHICLVVEKFSDKLELEKI